MTTNPQLRYNKFVSIHISNKLLSNRNLTIISIVCIVVGFIFVSLLTFYFPRESRINLSSLNSISIQSISKQKNNQIATTDLSIYNITKAIAKDGISIIYAGPVDKLNQDYETTNNAFAQIFASTALITSGQDNWIERKKNEIDQIQILNLSQSIKLRPKYATIDIGFGTQSGQKNSENFGQEILDYNYIMNESNLKTTIENIAELLIKLDSKNKDLYLKNQIELITQISNIEKQYSIISLCNKSPIITNSTNLNYLAQKYNLEISIFSGFDPLKTDSNQIKYIKDFAKSKNTNSFFVDKKIPLIDYNNLKSSLGMEIYFISDYVYPDIADTLSKNLENLKKSQNCQ